MKNCITLGILMWILSYQLSYSQSAELTLQNVLNILEMKGIVTPPTFKLSHALGTAAEFKILPENKLELNYSGSDITINPGTGDVIVGSKINVGNSPTDLFTNPDTEGDIRYNTSTTDIEGYTPDGWQSLTEVYEPPVSMADTLEVGDYYQGGIVFWLSDDKRYGKALALNIANSIHWSNVQVDQNITSDRGAMNTILIINQVNHTFSAALLCSQFSYGGYDDWYLPSTAELSIIYSEINTINPQHIFYTGFPFDTFLYWSSNNLSQSEAFYYDMRLGGPPGIKSTTKSSILKVLPVRAFSVE